jgi:hypothetical protein
MEHRQMGRKWMPIICHSWQN